MKGQEEIDRRLEREIFESCKRENRNPDVGEISILSRIDEYRMFEKIDKIVCASIKDKKDRTITVTQNLNDI